MGELKDITSTAATQYLVAAQATATMALLNGVAQGSTAASRLGRKITMKSIYLRYSARMGATSTGSTPVRIMIVYDKQTNAAAPAITDIVQADNVYTINNLGNSRRFVTLLDRVGMIGQYGPQVYNLEWYKKCNLEVQFNSGSAGTVGDIQTGSLYLIVWGSAGLTAADAAGGLYTRVRFEDN